MRTKDTRLLIEKQTEISGGECILSSYWCIRKAALSDSPALGRYFRRYHARVMTLDLSKAPSWPSHQRIQAYQQQHQE